MRLARPGPLRQSAEAKAMEGGGVQGGTAGLFLGIAMLAAFALAIGGLWLIAQRRDVKRGLLMLAMAVVLIGNVLIVAWPAGTPRPVSAAASGR